MPGVDFTRPCPYRCWCGQHIAHAPPPPSPPTPLLPAARALNDPARHCVHVPAPTPAPSLPSLTHRPIVCRLTFLFLPPLSTRGPPRPHPSLHARPAPVPHPSTHTHIHHVKTSHSSAGAVLSNDSTVVSVAATKHWCQAGEEGWTLIQAAWSSAVPSSPNDDMDQEGPHHLPPGSTADAAAATADVGEAQDPCLSSSEEEAEATASGTPILSPSSSSASDEDELIDVNWG